MCSYVILCLFLIYAGNIQAAGPRGSCRLEFPSDRAKNLFINTQSIQWREPKRPNLKIVENRQSVTLECENGFIQNELPLTAHSFRCTGGKYNETYVYEDLLCRNEFHKNVIVSKSYELDSGLLKCRGENLQIYDVSVRKPDGKVNRLYTVCFDKKVMRPKFTFQKSVPAAAPSQGRSYNRYDSREDIWGFDGYGRTSSERITLSQAYVENIQEPKMRLFDLRHGETKYPFYFNRGHLVPYSDFYEYEDQKATVEYINVAPQWKEFNKEQWSKVEQEARNVRRNDPNNWETYTGTYGIIENQRGEKIYLSVIIDHTRKGSYVPIPSLYWKIVYNLKDRSKSRVFIGINNPRINPTVTLPPHYQVCQPIVNPVTKKKFEGQPTEGFSYECKLADFLDKLKTNEKIVV